MKEYNYAFQNADTRPRLQRRTQNICFVISISPTVIMKRMVKITSIFGSYKFLRVVWHDIFLLSHHLLASWNLYIVPLKRNIFTWIVRRSLRADVSRYRPEVYKSEKLKILKKIHKVALGKLLT